MAEWSMAVVLKKKKTGYTKTVIIFAASSRQSASNLARNSQSLTSSAGFR